MPLFRAQAIFPFFTNLPRDVVVNQFHFLDDSADPAEVVADEIQLKLDEFYGDLYAAAVYRAGYINWASAYLKIFDLSQPTPRVPIIRPLTLPGDVSTTSKIPTEVACVLSFSAATQSGVPHQRIHNRIFLGGITDSMLDAGSASTFPRFNSSWVISVAAAAAALTPIETAATRWVQVSNAGGVTAVRPIVSGWVDNGPDTQRRRSVDASARQPWVAI